MWASLWQRWRQRWVAGGPAPNLYHAIGALIIGGSVGLCLVGYWVLPPGAPRGPDAGALPSALWPLGTDGEGRDLLAVLAHAQPPYFLLGLKGCLVGVGLGTVLGLAAGILRGRTDTLVRYVCVVVGSFPRLALLLLVATAFGTSMSTAVFALGVSFVPVTMSEVRQKVVDLAQEEFLAASRAHGIGWGRLVLYHVVWVHLRPFLVRQAAFVFAYVILVEAALSYIGSLNGYVHIGQPAPGSVPTLGQALAHARTLIDPSLEDLRSWWPLTVVAGHILVLVSGLTAFGEGLVRRAES